jgi:hypothetical protein
MSTIHPPIPGSQPESPLRRKAPARRCRLCHEEIHDRARICRYCHSPQTVPGRTNRFFLTVLPTVVAIGSLGLAYDQSHKAGTAEYDARGFELLSHRLGQLISESQSEALLRQLPPMETLRAQIAVGPDDRQLRQDIRLREVLERRVPAPAVMHDDVLEGRGTRTPDERVPQRRNQPEG